MSGFNLILVTTGQRQFKSGKIHHMAQDRRLHIATANINLVHPLLAQQIIRPFVER